MGGALLSYRKKSRLLTRERYRLSVRIFLSVLYVVAAILPLIGFGRSLYRVQVRLRALDEVVEQRGQSGFTWDDFDEAGAGDVRQRLWDERKALLWDITLIGSGLAIGAVASTWSLFLGS